MKDRIEMIRTLKIICWTLIIVFPLNAVFRPPLVGEYLDLIIFSIAVVFIGIVFLKTEYEKSMQWKGEQEKIFKYRNVPIRWWEIIILSSALLEFFTWDQSWSKFLALVGILYACEIVSRMVLHRKYGLYYISISNDKIIKKRGAEDQILLADIREVRKSKSKIVLVDLWFENFIIRPGQFLDSDKLRTLLFRTIPKENLVVAN